MPGRGRTYSEKRLERIRIVREMTARGASSRAIGRRLGIAPSTVRDYRTDPARLRARARQRRLGVIGVHMPEGGVPIESVKGPTRRWHPHLGESTRDAVIRGRQMRAVIGSYAHRLHPPHRPPQSPPGAP